MTAEERIIFQNGMVVGFMKTGLFHIENSSSNNNSEGFLFSVTEKPTTIDVIPLQLYEVVKKETETE